MAMTRQESNRKGYPKALWNRCALPESRVVKVNADLLAVEPLPAITKTLELGLLEEAGGWQKNARRDITASVPLLASRVALSEVGHHDDWKERVWVHLILAYGT